MQQFRCERNSIISVIIELWSLLWGALIEFVWADLRDGMIRMSGLSRPVRAIVWLGFALTAICLFLLTQAPFLRAIFPLYTSVTPAPGRGLHVPLILFPLSLFLLSLAWAFILVGARQSFWLIRLGAILLYTVTIASWLTPLLASDPRAVAAGGVLYGLLLVSYLLPRSRQTAAPLHFAIALFCVGGLFVVVQTPLITQDQASGLPIGKTLLESNLRSLATLAIPLLILIGLDIADFTIHAATWIGEAAQRIFSQTILALLTCALLAWLVWQGVDYFVNEQAATGPVVALLPLAGTSGLLLLLWLIWIIFERRFPPASLLTLDDFSSAASKVAVALVIAFLLPLLISFLFLEIAQTIETLSVELQSGFFGDFSSFALWASNLYYAATNFSTTVYNTQPLWQRFCAIIAVGAASILYRRGHAASALYAITVGANYLWVEVTRPGNLLQSLAWTSPQPMVFSWVLLILVWSIVLLARGLLTSERLHPLLLLTILLILLRQTSLIAAPLDPLFSLAGVGTLAVGLGWDLLTAGSWANVESKALPRTSRIFLYLGYVLLTVMLINWAVAAHDATLLDRFTGEAALTGLSLLGYPYLFAIFYLLLTKLPPIPAKGQSANVAPPEPTSPP